MPGSLEAEQLALTQLIVSSNLTPASKINSEIVQVAEPGFRTPQISLRPRISDPFYAGIAQVVEHTPGTGEVGSSSDPASSIFARNWYIGVRHPSKVF